MSDTSPKDQDAFTSGHQSMRARHVARTGEEVWRVTREGRTMICVLYNDAKVGAAWEVVLKHDDEWLFGRRCPDEAFARFVAKGMLQDHLNGGWTKTEP